jgi:glucosyl-3-phosphoglycerate synthase
VDAPGHVWAQTHTYSASSFDIDDLLRAKGARRISVVIPAKDEAETIGLIVTSIRQELMSETGPDGGSQGPLVDELIVMDSDSTDRTAEIARAAGACLYAVAEILPELGWFPGKGEAMWKSLFVSTGDFIVFIDADVTNFSTEYVMGLLGPLLLNPHGADKKVKLVKGFYDRDLNIGSAGIAQGGRVTELMARPLINVWWPELAGVIQPLAGEWAATRELLHSLYFPAGYGIELAVLIDTYKMLGLDALAQVDLGKREHRHQDLPSLSVMSAEVLAAAHRRNPQGNLDQNQDDNAENSLTMTHADTDLDGKITQWNIRPINISERPPAAQFRELAAGSKTFGVCE